MFVVCAQDEEPLGARKAVDEAPEMVVSSFKAGNVFFSFLNRKRWVYFREKHSTDRVGQTQKASRIALDTGPGFQRGWVFMGW